MRRYPTLFNEYPHVKYANMPCFNLTNIALNLHRIEMSIYSMNEMKCVEKLCKLLMMCRSRKLRVDYVHMLRWDLGFSYDYDKVLSSKYSDFFEVVKDENGVRFFKLVKWVDEYAVSELERGNESKDLSGDSEFYRRFKRGENGLGFELSFPRGYGAQKKVKLWMDEFRKVPYVSPYEDSSSIDPDSELMEKRVVGVLHELLSLTVYKKTKRNYIRNLADELNIPFRFTRIFTRYPGIFYLSLKCKTTSVMLKEGYRRGKLVNPCDIVKYRGKFHHVMRTGLIYRKKGLEMLPELDKVDVDVNDVIGVHKKEDEGEGEDEDDEVESSGEWVDHEDGDDDDEEFDDVSDQD
ncbi:root primordium defective 1-like protein [Tanacetum coccineum]